jgi:hypothetical protein
MSWWYLVCNVKFGGLGLSSYGLGPNYNIFSRINTQIASWKWIVLLDPNPKLELWKKNLEHMVKFSLYASWF